MKASILLITYNHELFIAQAIESILMQEGISAFEIVVSDDHSTDHTMSVVRQLLLNRPATRIFSNEQNLGITKNYQHSFSLCRGEYILVLEGDDYWVDPLKVKTQVNFLENNPGCVMCAHPFLIKKDNKDELIPFNINEQKPVEFFECKDLIMDPSIISNFSTACYRRSMLQKISPATYDVVSYEWMINMSVAQFGPIEKINKLMSVYRISSSGQWSKFSEEEKLIGNINILPEYDRILEGRYHIYFEKKIALFKEELDKLYMSRKNSARSPIHSTIINILNKVMHRLLPKKKQIY